MKGSNELLIESLHGWALLHGRKISDQAVEKWLEIFVNTPINVLAKALIKVTENAERMPTPGLLTKAIRETYDETGRIGRTESDPNCRKCLGIGFRVENLTTGDGKIAIPCDCRSDNLEVQRERYKSQITMTKALDDETFEEIDVVRDDVKGELLYKAVDCSEGREFINELHRLAGRKSIPFPRLKSEKGMERERQRQKQAYRKYLKGRNDAA